MRLIDADTLIKTVEGLQDCYNGFSDTYDKACIIGVIDEQPTIDAAPVVRCRDCKFFVSDMEWCEADDEHPTRPDAFCSWAERRTDE